jgi:hypothetical protein
MAALADDFREAITARASEKNLEVRLWQGVTQPSSHFLEISATPEPIVIYVATDEKKGSWSLAKSHVDQLAESNVEWAAVLLMGDIDRGWVVTGDEVKRQIQGKRFRLASKDKAYKILDKNLPENMKFQGFDALLDYLQLNWKL